MSRLNAQVTFSTMSPAVACQIRVTVCLILERKGDRGESKLPSVVAFLECLHWQGLERDGSRELKTQCKSHMWVVGTWLLESSPAVLLGSWSRYGT